MTQGTIWNPPAYSSVHPTQGYAMVARTKQIRGLESSQFTAQVVEYGPGFRLEEHSHEWTCFQVVLKGRFLESGTGSRDEMPPGTLIYRPAGSPHENPPTRLGSTSLCVRLTEDLRTADFPALAEVVRPQVLRAPQLLSIAGQIERELAQSDDLSPAVVEAQCTQILGWVVRESRSEPGYDEDRLTREARRLAESASERFVRVEALAQALNVSRYRLNRAFLRTTGGSTGAYLRGLRLLEARRLLEETRTPIAQIAQLSGFADQSHMTRQFRLAFGRTPAQLRGRPESPNGIA